MISFSSYGLISFREGRNGEDLSLVIYGKASGLVSDLAAVLSVGEVVLVIANVVVEV